MRMAEGREWQGCMGRDWGLGAGAWRRGGGERYPPHTLIVDIELQIVLRVRDACAVVERDLFEFFFWRARDSHTH